MERISLFKLVGAIFIAVIFVASYASFSSNSSAPAARTTTVTSIAYLPQYGASEVNASITGYSSVFSIDAVCNAMAVQNGVSAILNKLESNGSVSNYYSPSNSTISVQSGSMNSSEIYNYVSRSLNGTAMNCTRFSGQASIALPDKIGFTVDKYSFVATVPQQQDTYYIPIYINSTAHKNALVKVAALFTPNGTIYGNLSVTLIRVQ
ncbi:MAG: hypothetical protein ACP5K9_01175 [Candidatus Micrarchaeia archaeon]